MLSFSKSSRIGLSLGAGLLLAGCQSAAQRAAPASHEMAPAAVACDKCQITWVKYPVTGGPKGRQITGYGTRKRDACPDCKDAVSNFFATGTMKHECKACGGNLAICEKARPH